MDKFLLAENPMRPDSPGLYIISAVAPRCLIKVICLNDEEMVNDLSAIFDLFSYTSSDGLPEKYQLLILDYYDHKDVEDVPDNQVADYRTMLRKAWHWYKSYLEWEDENIDSEDYGKRN